MLDAVGPGKGLVRVGLVLADSTDTARPALRVAVYHIRLQLDLGRSPVDWIDCCITPSAICPTQHPPISTQRPPRPLSNTISDGGVSGTMSFPSPVNGGCGVNPHFWAKLDMSKDR
jgi:hypothetical protein